MADLDRERIARAALRVIDESGFKGFSMRAVAKQLDVTPMALYHYVADKDALASLTLEAVMSEHPMPAEQADWRDDLLALSLWIRESTLSHPAVAQLRRAHQIWLPGMFDLIERWRSCWLRSGLSEAAARRASGASSLAIIGLIDEEVNILQFSDPDPQLMDKLPNLSAIFTTAENARENFELVVRSLIQGLCSELADQSAH